MAYSSVKDAIVAILSQQPDASNASILEFVQRNVPGSKATPVSISSYKSTIKRQMSVGQDVATANDDLHTSIEEESAETDEEIAKRLTARYEAYERLAQRVIDTKLPSLIVSGPAGIGKSYIINKRIEEKYGEIEETIYDDEDGEDAIERLKEEAQETRSYDIIKGTISAVGLYKSLYQLRNGGVLILDDCDAVFAIEEALNMLKGALDSSPIRTISWRKQAKWLEEAGIPDRFQFKGSVIFLTNIDFAKAIERNNRYAEHLKALIDRSMYLSLSIRTRRDIFIRIKQIVGGKKSPFVEMYGMKPQQIEEMLSFIEENLQSFYSLSLRLTSHIAQCMVSDPETWKEDIIATKMGVR